MTGPWIAALAGGAATLAGSAGQTLAWSNWRGRHQAGEPLGNLPSVMLMFCGVGAVIGAVIHGVTPWALAADAALGWVIGPFGASIALCVVTGQPWVKVAGRVRAGALGPFGRR